jgi:hypothetical protein
MRKKVVGLFGVMALMLSLSSPSPAYERHPEIRAAVEALENAKRHLQEAAHDFHGHRADAIRSVDEALRQLRVCMQYD